MDTASSQVEVFSICLFSSQTDGEHNQIKNTWLVKMWYSGCVCGLSISPSCILSGNYKLFYKPGKNMEFGHCWYMKSVFCNILQIWILYTYMYYILIVIVKMSNSQNIIFHICMNSKYKRKKKRKNINVRKMFTSYLN